MDSKILRSLTLAILLTGCVGLRLETKKEGVVPSGPYHRTLVVYLRGDRDTKSRVETAFREAFRETQSDPGRGLDVTEFAMGNPTRAAQLGYDSVLVVDHHSMVHWGESHPGTLAEAFAPLPKENPLAQTTVQSQGPGGQRYANGCARLYDAVTTRLVWTAHGTLRTDKDEWTTRPARVAAQAVVRHLKDEGFLNRIP
ncbi:MAG: hypothetical protein JNK54_06920 [Elusimicrobia bacterium]|jgi:hypothetical protein|nr:hypothetical protein [Elusimicrobiota bacterium]